MATERFTVAAPAAVIKPKMLLMRRGGFDVRVRPADLDDFTERGFEVIGEFAANTGVVTYRPEVKAEMDKLEQQRAEREHREHQAQQAAAAALASAGPDTQTQALLAEVQAQLAEVLRASAQAAERAEAAEAKAAEDAPPGADPDGGDSKSAAKK